jgi:hypothetical protein
MYQQDYLLNETRKFALLLARLMGLKAEGSSEEYLQLFNHTLQAEYDAELEQLFGLNECDFEERLLKANYSAEKLNALSQLFYMFAEPFEGNTDTVLILKKVLVIFDVLEQHHHTTSFENLEKRKTIYQFLTTPYART